MKMKRFLSQIIAATAGLWLANQFVPGVTVTAYPDSSFFGIQLTAQWEIFLLLGIALGLLNYFIKPILKAISLPLEIITLGFFTIVINMGIIWFLDLTFDEIYFDGLLPILYTTVIIWGISLVLHFFLTKNED